MRGTTRVIYTSIFRAQALMGLMLASWLVSMVLGRGQYASAPLIIGVVAGVIGLACLWPYLTPSWLGRPKRRKHLIPMMSAHLVLPLLYGFVGMSAIVAADMTDAVGGQIAVVIAATLVVTAALCGTIGARLCLQDPANLSEANESVVTELVLPQAKRGYASDTERDERMSQAS